MKKTFALIAYIALWVGCLAQQYNVTAGTNGVIKVLPNGTAVKAPGGGTSGQVQWNNGGAIAGFTATGDLTIDTTTGVATITANAVTNAKSAKMAANTIKGNNTGALANAGDLSASQAKSLLAISTGDVSGLGSIATQNSNAVNISGGTISGANVTGLAPPVAGTDAVNLNYVSGLSAGITPRIGTAVASTANLTLSGEQTIDGVVTSASRILVKNQTTTSQNGIYVTGAGAWSRASDSNTAAQLKFGYYYFVSAGTTQSATSWFIATAPTVLGSDPVVFSQFSASQTYLNGTGLSLTGNTFSITAPIAATLGGTGQTGYSTGDTLYALNATTISRLSLGASNAIYQSNGATVQWVTNPTLNSLQTANIGNVTPGTAAFTTLSTTSTTQFGVAASVNSTGANDVFWAMNNSGGGGGGFTWNLRAKAATAALEFYNGTTPSPLSVAYSTGITTLTQLAISSNANLRTTKGNLNIPVNVKDYGALGDGSTNDTVAIAAAATALPSTNAVLYFPAGTYVTDTVAITGKTGLTVYGDGNGTSTLKNRTGGVVITVATSSGVTIRNLTFDGNCSVRTPGATAVNCDVSSNLIFTNNTIKNSGQYNILIGGSSTQNTDVNITNNVLLGGYADGINLQYVSKFVVANNTIDGVDDDCIAIGYNGSGFATQGVVSGNFCRARNDLGTATGRGIWVGKATDILIANNNIDTIKQTGIWISDDGTGTRPSRISVKNNKVRNVATSSGHGISVYKADYVTLEGNTVENPQQGSCIEIADWQFLSIKGGTLTQSLNTFGRGIHCDESASWSATWTGLMISDVDIRMLGAATDACIYLSPDASVTMSYGSIVNVTGYQVAGGNYIAVSTARMAQTWKIGNNTTATPARTVSPASSGGAGLYTVFNNN